MPLVNLILLSLVQINSISIPPQLDARQPPKSNYIRQRRVIDIDIDIDIDILVSPTFPWSYPPTTRLSNPH